MRHSKHSLPLLTKSLDLPSKSLRLLDNPFNILIAQSIFRTTVDVETGGSEEG